ncbi:hypothetical protein [Streptomyces sp. NPDC057557]|uniref:hypothetical protein n=1 Tax=Streptomyces sp. NPDC057557 TaxID=3346167 RepID=UPI0036A309B9
MNAGRHSRDGRRDGRLDAPDGPTAGGRRLFDIFRGPHFTLPAVGTDTELPASDGDLVRVHRSESYEACGKGLFLIRPDGCLGWAGEDTSGLAAYLAPLGVTAAARR